MSRPANKRERAVSPETAALHRLDALSRVMNAGVLLLDRSGALEFASPMASSLLGCESQEALRRRWSELKELMGMGTDIADPPAGSGPLRWVVDVPAGNTGTVRSLRLEIHPLEGDSCSGRLILLKDRRTVDMLETDLVLASQMRSLVHVYRVMAHDLKAPLNSMQLTLELLADSLSDDDHLSLQAGPRERRRRHIAILREELMRLNRSLQSMLDQGEPLGTVPHAFDLRELAREIARLLTPQARRQRVELNMQLPDDDVNVTGYRDRLKQALINLALSGLEGMAGGGRLTIQIAKAAGAAEIRMQDTGTGISDGLLEEIYQNLYSREKSRDGARLYVARLVVESHGGEMAVESDPGHGTRFHVTLPLATGVTATSGTASSAGAR